MKTILTLMIILTLGACAPANPHVKVGDCAIHKLDKDTIGVITATQFSDIYVRFSVNEMPISYRFNELEVVDCP
jgi:hypothetical protein